MTDKPKEYSILILGNTGAGKSSLLNMIGGGETEFEESDKSESMTKMAMFKTYKWLGEGCSVRMCDTQGLSDTQGLDTKHIKQMIEEVKTVTNIDLVILALMGEDPRMTEYLQNTVQLFVEIFGQEFLSHTVLVFTKWRAMVKSKQEETTRRTEFQKQFKQLFGVENIPCYFIDSHFNQKQTFFNVMTQDEVFDYLPEALQKRTRLELSRMFDYMSTKTSSLDVTQATAKKTKTDRMKDELNNAIISTVEVPFVKYGPEIVETIGPHRWGNDEQFLFIYCGRREYRTQHKKRQVISMVRKTETRGNGSSQESERELGRNWEVLESWNEYCYHAAVGNGHGWVRE